MYYSDHKNRELGCCENLPYWLTEVWRNCPECCAPRPSDYDLEDWKKSEVTKEEFQVKEDFKK